MVPFEQGADDLMRQQARSPAYTVLADHGLLSSQFRLEKTDQIPMRLANSTRSRNAMVPCGPCVPCVQQFMVPGGKIMPAEDGEGGYFFYGPGVHLVMSPFVQRKPAVSLTDQRILHGPIAIITVPQGFIGYAMDRGQPLLLSPGMHYWNSDTIVFQKHIDLSDPVINLGPFTLVTVDEGYAAVTQNNGQQSILRGGAVYLLTHRNWKFEKFMTEKIQTDDIDATLMQTADNVLLQVSATVTWTIDNVETAARMAAQTMYTKGGDGDVNMPKLRNDVLKQALASLSAFIGSLRYSDSFGMATAVSSLSPATLEGQEAKEPEGEHSCSPLFDEGARSRLKTAVEHCNEITMRYGIRVQAVNIISAMPKDAALMTQLAAAAVAAAEAEKRELEAHGSAKARLIEAEAEAESERRRAQGAKDAADTLGSSSVAVEMERIRNVGAAIGDKATLFFGANSSELGNLMSNPNVVSR